MTDTLICGMCGKPEGENHMAWEGHWFMLEVNAADDVDEAVLAAAEDVADGWYADTPIDWEDVWDRLDGSLVWNEGPRAKWALSMGSTLDSPAQRKIQREIRKRRRDG